MSDLVLGMGAFVFLFIFIGKITWRNLFWTPVMGEVLSGDVGYARGIFKSSKRYQVKYSFNQREIIKEVFTREVCPEGAALILSVNPRNPEQVHVEYAGKYISRGALWVQPVFISLFVAFLVWKFVSLLILASQSGVSLSQIFYDLSQSQALSR